MFLTQYFLVLLKKFCLLKMLNPKQFGTQALIFIINLYTSLNIQQIGTHTLALLLSVNRYSGLGIG